MRRPSLFEWGFSMEMEMEMETEQVMGRRNRVYISCLKGLGKTVLQRSQWVGTVMARFCTRGPFVSAASKAKVVNLFSA